MTPDQQHDPSGVGTHDLGPVTPEPAGIMVGKYRLGEIIGNGLSSEVRQQQKE